MSEIGWEELRAMNSRLETSKKELADEIALTLAWLDEIGRKINA